MAKRKPWIFLPFLGSSEEPEKRIATGQTNKPRENGTDTGNGIRGGPEYDLKREYTAKTVAQKTEEDIVQDYNAPIHMWVSRFRKCKPIEAFN
jgi:hypothetical protein